MPAHSFLWGYDDELIEKSKTWSLNPPKFNKFGMLVTVNIFIQFLFEKDNKLKFKSKTNFFPNKFFFAEKWNE